MTKKLLTFQVLHIVLISACAFFLLTTFTAYYIQHILVNSEAKSLYREATLISNDYAVNFYNDDMTLEAFTKQLIALDSYLDAKIWVVNTDGSVLIDSNGSGENKLNNKIEGFTITDFGNKYYMTGTFYNNFDEDQLTVYAPISMTFKVRGYIIINRSISSITGDLNNLMTAGYYSLGIFLIIFVVFETSFWFFTIRPVKKLAKVASEYANGDFSKELRVSGSNEIGQLAGSVKYMAHELQSLEDDQKKFVSNVSHDFRSPLTSIKGYVEAILDGTIPVEIQGKYLNIILYETDRLTKLTESLLELNKYGRNGTYLDLSSFDINQLIKTTCLTFEGRCIEKRISFELILTGDKTNVLADKSKIQQVVHNLIDNALKFSPVGSTITVETTLKNGKAFISVKDHGVGIPTESQNKIWERFYKTDPSRGKDKKGTGLGLAIVKEIIQAHKENINVISTEGVGSEFIFSLPLDSEDESP